MRKIKIYRPPGRDAPVELFMSLLEPRMRKKLLWKLFLLSQAEYCELKEPHYKHFVLERYSELYELREKGKVLVRIIFTIQDGDIILLQPFIKRQQRDTMRALEQALDVLSVIRKNPDYAADFHYYRGE